MKKIEATLRPDRLDHVKKALEDVGVLGMTVSTVSGHGRQKGIPLRWRAGEMWVDMLPKIKLELVVADSEVKKIIEVILEKARTGEVGDGKIFVLPVEEAIRVRTGDNGESAI